MKDSRSKAGRASRTAKQGPAPHVLDIVETMEEPRAALVIMLREMALSLPDVVERTLYDGFCRHWTPAYYLRERQLFHVHNFKPGLRATIFVGANNLEPLILDCEQVAPDLRVTC